MNTIMKQLPFILLILSFSSSLPVISLVLKTQDIFADFLYVGVVWWLEIDLQFNRINSIIIYHIGILQKYISY